MAGKGVGSTAGQLGGAAIGAYTGVPQGAQIGATAGGALGGLLDPQSGQPIQTQQRMGTFNPYQQFGALGQIENAVLANMGRGGGGGNPYVGPRPEQERMLAALEGYQGQASPLFGEGVAQQRGTVGGQYLDPMNAPAFQRLADARQSIARQLFGEFAPQYSSAAIARGNPYGSSSQMAGVQRGGERLSTQAAQDIAQAGWGQYGRERELQEQAARGGMQLAPGLAAKVFGAGEELRGAQQAGNLAEIESNLRAQGLNNQQVQTALEYMRMRGLRPVEPILGKSPYEMMTGKGGYIQSAAPLVQGLGAAGGQALADWWKNRNLTPGANVPTNPGGATEY